MHLRKHVTSVHPVPLIADLLFCSSQYLFQFAISTIEGYVTFLMAPGLILIELVSDLCVFFVSHIVEIWDALTGLRMKLCSRISLPSTFWLS